MRRGFRLLLLLVLPLMIAGVEAQTPPVPDLEARRKALNDLLHEEWEHRLSNSPLLASFLGDKRWNDKLDDFSQETIDRQLADARKFLACFEAIDTTGFPEQEVLNKELMVRDLKDTIEGAHFKPQEMPVDQQNGVQVGLPQLVLILSFHSVKDYDDYTSRLNQMPRLLDQVVVQMRKGMDDKLMPPKFILDEVLVQCETLAKDTPEKSPFAQPFAKFPDSIPAAEQARLKEAGTKAVRDAVLPAYVHFAKFVKEEYAPHGRTEPGVSS